MSQVEFRAVKDAVTIDRVAEQLGMHLKKKGEAQYKTACPTCGGREALIISPHWVNKDGSMGRYTCFAPACFAENPRGGDVISLVAKARKCSDREAAEYLAQSFNVTAPAVIPKRDFSHVENELVPDHEALKPLGVPADVMKAFGCGWRGKGFGSGRLLMPVHDPHGVHLGYTARAVKQTQDPMYRWPKDLDANGLLFNAHKIEKGDLYFFTDPIKVLVAWQHDVQAVASYGPPSAKTLDALSALMTAKGIDAITNL